MSLNILHEYSVWQFATAVGLLFVGFLFAHSLPIGKVASTFITLLSLMLFLDEILMIHECVKENTHYQLMYLFYCLTSLMLFLYLRKKVKWTLKAKLVACLSISLAIIDFGLDSELTPLRTRRIEEICELLFVVNGFYLWKQFEIRFSSPPIHFYLAYLLLCIGISTLFMLKRPDLCPQVNYWGNKFWKEQVWSN